VCEIRRVDRPTECQQYDITLEIYSGLIKSNFKDHYGMYTVGKDLWKGVSFLTSSVTAKDRSDDNKHDELSCVKQTGKS